MKSRLLLLMLLLMGFSAVGQESHDSLLYWSEYPLEWSDFEGVPNANGESGIVCTFVCLPLEESLGNVRSERYQLYAAMVPKASWIDTANQDYRQLAYNQVIFDLAELVCRDLQPLISDEQRAQEAAAAAMWEWESSVARLQQATNYGANDSVVAVWQDSIVRLLEATPDNPVESQYKNGWGMGISVGLGTATLFDADVDGPASAFPITADLRYGRHLFGVFWRSATFFSKEKVMADCDDADYLYTQYHSFSQKGFFLRYGYNLIDNHRSRLTPFVGVGSSTVNNNIELYYEPNHRTDAAFLMGVAFSLKVFSIEELQRTIPSKRDYSVGIMLTTSYDANLGWSYWGGLACGFVIQMGR